MPEIPVISLGISILARAVSVGHVWLNLLRRGTLHATRPTVVYFGADAGGDRDVTTAEPRPVRDGRGAGHDGA